MSDASDQTLLEEPPLAGWRTLIRSFTTLAVGEIIARLAGLVALIVIARKLEPYGFGLIALGAVLVSWFATVADSGTELISMRNVSRRPERFRSIADAVLGLRLALSLVAMIIFAAGVMVATGGDGRGTVLILFALVIPPLALNLRWIVLGVEGARSVAIGNIGSQILFVAGVLLLVTGEDSTSEVPMLRAASELLYAVIVLGFLARRFGVPVPRVDLGAWRMTLGQSLPIMANNVARTLIYSADFFLIAAFLGSEQVGFYGAAYNPVLFVVGMIALFSTAFLSSYSAARLQASRHRLGAQALSLGVVLSFPVAALMTVSSPVVVPLIYGGAYQPTIVVFAILSWTIPLMAMAIPYSCALIATDKQMLVMRHNLAAAAFNIGTNLVAVPLLGIRAAAAITVASFGIVLALNHRSAVSLGLVPPIAASLRQWRQPVPAVALRTPSPPEL